MDQLVKRIRPKDYELSSVQDNIASAVDQLLANSTAGFTSFLPAGVWQQTASSGRNQLVSTPGGLFQRVFCRRPGSIIALDGQYYAPQGGNVFFTINKNGVQVAATSVGTGTTNGTFVSATFPKGQVAFAKGDYLEYFFTLTVNQTSTFFAALNVQVEMGF